MRIFSPLYLFTQQQQQRHSLGTRGERQHQQQQHQHAWLSDEAKDATNTHTDRHKRAAAAAHVF